MTEKLRSAPSIGKEKFDQHVADDEAEAAADRWSVPNSGWATPAATTGTAGPLQRLEPVPLGLNTDRYNASLSNVTVITHIQLIRVCVFCQTEE
jgi:hypothetical protein